MLRGARGLRGMTQARLAVAIGVHVTNISEMERGLRPIGKEMAKRLAKALDMPYKAFL
ncbi:helix-turn-helix domain-containing protein [Alkalidesulfovibrio alkalitolerans]|nr:helix-turn-helix transcriptional regulator [Alkalidesulfovibrio alkalitolerans]